MVSTKIGFPSLSAKARGLSGLSPSGLGRAGLAKNGFGRAGFRARPEARPSLEHSYMGEDSYPGELVMCGQSLLGASGGPGPTSSGLERAGLLTL